LIGLSRYWQQHRLRITLARIIHLFEEVQEQKGKTQLFIEQFGRRYSPAILLMIGKFQDSTVNGF